jgi:Mrp family chromosome partitioning ATPase/capsular polysaccharide biosynthesis protein
MDVQAERAGPGLGHYIEVIYRRRWIVLGIVATAIAVAALVSHLQQPVYQAQEKIVIGQGNTLFQPQNGNVIQPFTATMANLLTSDIVARDVISTLGLPTSPSSLLKKVSVSTNPQTAVLQVSVDDQNADRARRIASAFGDAFARLVQLRFGGGGRQAQPPITAIVFDPAHIVPGRIAPKPAQNIAIAAALGLVLGLLAAFLAEHFDRTIRTREAFEATFRLPVIGQVPRQPRRGSNDAAALYGARAEASEAYRALRARLNSLSAERNLRTLVVTSPTDGQGKEMVAANLARALTSAGASTLLIEGDLRHPRLDTAFGRRSPGLTDVLAGRSPFEDAVRTIVGSPAPAPTDVPTPVPKVQQQRPARSPSASTAAPPSARRRRSSAARKVSAPSTVLNARFDFLPSGHAPPDPADLLSGKPIMTLMAKTADSYDHVLVDATPLLSFADALELANVADGVVLVARQNRATEAEAKAVGDLLAGLDARAVGVVVTDTNPRGRYGRRAPRHYLGELLRDLRGIRRRLSHRRAKPAAADPVAVPSNDR